MVALSFILLIAFGYWVAIGWSGFRVVWTIHLFYGTTLVLWYFLFVYLLPWAWPLFVIFASGTVNMYIERMNGE